MQRRNFFRALVGCASASTVVAVANSGVPAIKLEIKAEKSVEVHTLERGKHYIITADPAQFDFERVATMAPLPDGFSVEFIPVLPR